MKALTQVNQSPTVTINELDEAIVRYVQSKTGQLIEVKDMYLFIQNIKDMISVMNQSFPFHRPRKITKTIQKGLTILAVEGLIELNIHHKK